MALMIANLGSSGPSNVHDHDGELPPVPRVAILRGIVASGDAHDDNRLPRFAILAGIDILVC